MKLRILRGSHEIGGSCVEVESNGCRIVVDIGMPLVDSRGQRFDIKKYHKLAGRELVNAGILPDIRGFYRWAGNESLIDGLFISHAHLDHYGLSSYLHEGLHYYLGEGTKKLIDLSKIFMKIEGTMGRYSFLKSGNKLKVGAFNVTPYLMDHSAFDSYAFLIESGGKRILYSGDFRGHGRKPGALPRLLRSVPKGVDAFLLEGTIIGREADESKTEQDIEKELTDILKERQTIVLGIAASQNIDRLVSFYKAARRAKRLFLIDVYTANILDALKEQAKLPYPSRAFPDIKVYFPKGVCDQLARGNRRDLMNKFSGFKMTRDAISIKRAKILMMVRPSMTFDLSRIKGIESSLVIYSMWEGYLKDGSAKKFLEFVDRFGIEMKRLHTSGHASISTLQKVVHAIKPKSLIPIHTFHPGRYRDIFPGTKILSVQDEETICL